MNFSTRAIKSIKEFFFDTYHCYKREYDKENKKHSRVHPITSSNKSSNYRKIRKLSNREYDEEDDFDRRIFGERFPPIADMASEAQAYLFEKRAPPEQTCPDYYSGNIHNYPVVCRMARDILAIPATSAPTEALFSRVRKMTTKRLYVTEQSLIKHFAILKSRGVLQDNKLPGIIYNIENFDLHDDDDDYYYYDDDQEDWVDEDEEGEEDTKIKSLLVGEDIIKVFHKTADSKVPSETE